MSTHPALFRTGLLGAILFFIAPADSPACPLVIHAGPRQHLEAAVGGYCRINGSDRMAAPLSGANVRRLTA